MMDELVSHARTFALEHHSDQKYGAKPYIYHLDAVAKLVEPYSIKAQIIAYLHDILEDTKVTYQHLTSEFGEDIARCVQLVTDDQISNPQQRTANTYTRLVSIEKSSKDAVALIVKVADRLANMQASLETRPMLLALYIGEHPRFKQAAYRPRLCDDLWEKIEELAKIPPGSLFKKQLRMLFGFNKLK
jgi:guanosine-3',5'-bis(diphosphate) 3'-pyrophosphohydrolase